MLENRVDKRSVLIFLLIAFGLSWPIVLVLDTAWPGNIGVLYLSHGLAMLMPGLACVIVRKWVSRKGFSDCGFAVGGYLPYLAVICACLLFWGLPRLADVLWGGGRFGGYSRGLMLFSVLMVVGYLVPAFGEELGWRGFLLQELLPLGRNRALLIHGAIWGAWHWPLLFAAAINGYLSPAERVQNLTRYGLTPEAGKAVLVVGGLVGGMVAMVFISAFLGVIVGWLRLRFGSLYLVTFWHAYYDYFRDMLYMWFKPGRLLQGALVFPIFAIVAVGICLLLWGKYTPNNQQASPTRPCKSRNLAGM